MLVIDIDNFKLVNDTMGHSKGDNVLIEMAKTLIKIFVNDECICRLGGDEFMIFIPIIEMEEYALEKANAIIKDFPRDIIEGDMVISVSCSIGIAYKKPLLIDDNLYEELYQKSDAAMYRAKKNGKGQIEIFD